ncbi:MAG TPA: hypothetical protein VD886_05255 [Herpetosiphonaceae bacterium]|nr:hypothetical protein [Herpetosiphonaceae bacterium]
MNAIVVMCGSSFIPEWFIFAVGLVLAGVAFAIAVAIKAAGLALARWEPYRSWVRDSVILLLVSGVGGYLLLLAVVFGLSLLGVGLEIDGEYSINVVLWLAVTGVLLDGLMLERWANKRQAQSITLDDQGQLAVEGHRDPAVRPWRTALIANIPTTFLFAIAAAMG